MTESEDLLAQHLNSADLGLVDKARAFVKKAVPPSDGAAGVTAAYLSDNLRLQDALSFLHQGVKRQLSRKAIDLYQKEAELRESGKEEGWKSTEERSVMCHSDATYRDKKQVKADLENIAVYLSSLEWNLKSSAAYCLKK